VVVTVGETLRDPEAPDAGKPAPLQVLALVLLHISVEDWPLGIEGAKAERVAVGAGAVAACSTTIAGRFVGCEGAPTLCGGARSWISCPGALASCVGAGISAVFEGIPELGDELMTCPEVNSGRTNRLSFVVANTGSINIGLFLYWLQLGLIYRAPRSIVSVFVRPLTWTQATRARPVYTYVGTRAAPHVLRRY
jgi:hypothetical protein